MAVGKPNFDRLAAVLDKEFPKPQVELEFSNPLELLVATILSAQSTDRRVNEVTGRLFKTYRSAADYAAADPERLEAEIRSTGFFRAKTKSLIGMGRALVERFGGAVPGTMEELTTLPGVGRKTANVILGNCFGQPSIVVDTHVTRVSQRLALTAEKEAHRIEADLADYLPKKGWTRRSHQLLLHGRYICLARSPKCQDCDLRPICVYYRSNSGQGDRPRPVGVRRGKKAPPRGSRAFCDNRVRLTLWRHDH